MRGARAMHDFSGELTASTRRVVQLHAEPNELLLSLCWCESTTVVIEQRDVVALRTRSCGALRCHGPNGEHETSAQRAGRRLYSWSQSIAPALHEKDHTQP